MKKNIVALMTHSNGKPPKNVLQALKAANIRCAKVEQEPLYFQFDNCQDYQRKDEDKEDHPYKITMTGMSQFTEHVGRTAPQKLRID